jgi:hypothetical protein
MSERSDGEVAVVIEHEGGLRGQVCASMPDETATEEDVEHFKETLLNKLTLMVGKDPATATDRDWFVATTLSLRDRMIHRWRISG